MERVKELAAIPTPLSTPPNITVARQPNLSTSTLQKGPAGQSGKDFEGDTVGLANKFAMCTANSGGVNQDHHGNLIGLASTVAHEMGHNFGLSHDGPGCVCGPLLSHNCVMAERLSDCSLQQLAEFMERARPGCLRPPASVRTVAGGPHCGNAMLEPGEECDCGSVELEAPGSVCRRSAGSCDLPEYCTGQSEDCPEDSFQMNGEPCYSQAPGYCHQGQCPSREQHCWRLFGDGAKVGPDLCFNLNKRGEEGSSCGRDKSGFIPCSSVDVKCGTMFCVGGGESITGKRAGYPMFGMECKLAVEDDKIRNIDMVPTGTSCGTNKVCLSNKCVDVSVYGKKEECSKKCGGKG
ncbi:unnamed protein product, partial [Menidia menidia]